VLLSILDLQLPAGSFKYDKREIAAYVFLNDTCLDCVNLGSPSLPDSQQQSSQLPGAPRVKIPMVNIRKRLQIVVKRVLLEEGKKPQRDLLVKKTPNTFGSVTFNMAKLAHSKERSLIQWVTLYDDPSDDLYDGTLGVDDEYPPRLLLEYTILGGKYTSLMSAA